MNTNMRDMHDRGEERYLTPSEAASLLPNTSVDSIRRWIRRGTLMARRLPNGRYLVRRSDVETLLAPVVPHGSTGSASLAWPSPASPAEAGSGR